MSACFQCQTLSRAISAGEERRARCSDCGAELRAAGSRVARAEWSPRARRDMAALASVSDVRAIDLDPASKLRGGEASLERDLSHERTRTHARLAERRLAQMRARGPEGVRFVRALWVLYGVRGPELDARESGAVAVAGACLTWDDWPVVVELRRAVVERAGLRGVAVPDLPRLLGTTLGNALVGAAVDAYERDEWRDWRPAPFAPAASLEEPARVRRAREMLARLAAARGAT